MPVCESLQQERKCSNDSARIQAAVSGADVPQPADGKVAPEGAPYGYQSNTPQPMCIEWDIGAIRSKVVELQFDPPPFCICSEILAIRLPWLYQAIRSQVNAVILAISENVDFNPTPLARIHDITRRREIEGGLNKSAVVFQADVSAQTDGGPAGDDLPTYHSFRNSAHDFVLTNCQALPIVATGNPLLKSSIIADLTDILPFLSIVDAR